MSENKLISKNVQTLIKERRATTRYKYTSNFKIESVNLKKVDLSVTGIDISCSGIGFMSSTHFEVNDILEISFKYNNVTIPAIIKIQHVNLFDLGFTVGGQFIALQNNYRELLKHLV